MSFSILIVDDREQNARVIRELIESVEADDATVLIANDIHSAKTILSRSSIDLLVVDIALPLRAGEQPVPDGGVRLLREVFRRDKYERPRYVIGITAMEEVNPEVEAYFEENLWFLLYWRASSDVWKQRFTNFFAKVIEANAIPKITDYEFDVFVIGSKPEIELMALRDVALPWSASLPLDDMQFFREAPLKIGASDFKIGIGSPPRQGLVSATMYSAKVIEKLRPRFLCMTGICAGIREHCGIGDAILASESWEWQAGKYVSTEEAFRSEPYQLAVSPAISARFQELSEDQQFLSRLHADWRGEKPDKAPQLQVGPIASGSAVVGDERIVERIRSQHRRLLGIDMEVYGSYYSAAHASFPRPGFFAIKCASDFADSEKSDKFQRYCAYLSAEILCEFLKRNLADLTRASGA